MTTKEGIYFLREEILQLNKVIFSYKKSRKNELPKLKF